MPYQSPFAPAQIDFSKIGQLYDSYTDAQEGRMKRDAFAENQMAQRAARGRATANDARAEEARAKREAALGSLPRNPDGSINFQAAAERFIEIGEPEQAKTFMGIDSERRKTARGDIHAVDGSLVRVGHDGQPSVLYQGQGRAAANTPESRARDAERVGLDPNSDAGKAYILTGKLPREDQQSLTATDKKAILEADEMVSANQGAINALGEATRLSPQANQGWFAGTRASIGNNLPDLLVPDFVSSPESSAATTNLDNAVIGNALAQLKTIFGGNPTEGERKILIELQGASNQPNKVRLEIFRRAQDAAERRLKFNQERSDSLRGGTFYKPEGAPQQAAPGASAAPVRVQSVDEARRLPSGTVFVDPNGVTRQVP